MVIGDDIAVLADLDGDGPVFYGVEECHLCAYEGPRHVGLAKVEEHLPKLVDWFAERGGENDRRAGYRQFGYDDLLNFLGVKVARGIAYGIYYLIDLWIVEGLVNMGGYIAAGTGGIFRKIQTGYVRFYAFVMLLGGAGLLGYFLYMLNKLGGSP